jgi:hypothetical protein
MATLQLRIDLTNTGQGHNLRYQLDDAFYVFNFRFNGVSQLWYFDLFDDDENLLYGGCAVTISEGTEDDQIIDLLSPVRYKDVPPGRLFAIDTGGTFTESGLEDMDERVVFLYEEAGT